MADAPSSLIESLTAEANRIEEDALYSAKGHFEAARDWDRWHLAIGSLSALAAAFAGISGLRKDTLTSALLAFVASASAVLLTFLDPKERAARHLRAGNLYKSLHNDCRIFRQIECQHTKFAEQLTSGLKHLNTRRNSLNSESPLIPRRAFLRAQKGIERGEADYKVDHT